MTAAAIACNSSPSPSEGRGEPRRSTWIIPAKPARTELSMKQVILTASVRDAHRRRRFDLAAGRLDPVAEVGQRQDRGEHHGDARKPEHREPDEADVIGEDPGRDVGGQNRRKPGRNHHGDGARGEQHSERRDERGNGEAQGDEAVEEPDQPRRPRGRAARPEQMGRRPPSIPPSPWAPAQTPADQENIELAGNHQDRHAHRDQRHFGQKPEHAAHVLVGEEEPVRGELEQHEKSSARSTTPAS